MREANLHLDDGDFDRMGIGELIRLSRDAGIRDLEELSCAGAGGVVQVELDARLDEEELDGLSYVNEWDHVADLPDKQVYIISFTAPKLPDNLENQAEELVGTCSPDLTEDGSDLTLVGEQKAIAETVDEYRDADVSPELRTLSNYEGHGDPLDDLTDRQREIIDTAHEMGYYEVPRQVSTDDIAEAVGVDPSTVTEHLQRAERNLLGEVL